MKRSYETLDEYLDDLDKIKEGIAEETDGFTPKQVQAYFARARQEHVAGLHAGDAGGQGGDDPPQNPGSVAVHGCDSAAELVSCRVPGKEKHARSLG